MFFIQKRSREQQFTDLVSIDTGSYVYLGLVFDGQYYRSRCKIKYLNKSKTEGFINVISIDDMVIAYLECEPKLKEAIHFNVVDIEDLASELSDSVVRHII